MSAAGGLISLLVGTVLLRLTVTGTYQRYVRVGMGPWLALAGVVVIALGVVTLVRVWRGGARGGDGGDGDGDGAGHEGEPGRHHHHDDGHGHRDGIGWFLLAPIAALLLVAPPALGSYGVDRGATVDVRAGVSPFEPLAAGAEPAPMTLLEFNQRAFDRDGVSFDGASVQLTGFVADQEAEFRIGRYQIACCAVDAAPVVARIVDTLGEPPPLDQWVVVTGTFRPGGDDVPELAATSVVEVPAPDDPYE